MNRSNSQASGADTPRWLLVSDIDDTFLGDDAATAELIQLQRQNPQLQIALNSSRPIASVRQTLQRLPAGWRPAATITAMGTEIAVNGAIDEGWRLRFDRWRRDPVDALAARLGWTPHIPIYQTPLKASFNLPGGAQADRQAARAAIESLPMQSAIVISGPGDIDVLPTNAGKGPPTLRLAELLDIPIERLIVAGDSANDLAMFQVCGKGIVVGNARDELSDALRDMPGVFFATRAHAAGIIEGLRHYGALPSPPIVQSQGHSTTEQEFESKR